VHCNYTEKEKTHSGDSQFLKSPKCLQILELLTVKCKFCANYAMQQKHKRRRSRANTHESNVMLSPKSARLAVNIKSLDSPKRAFIENQVQNANRDPNGRRYTPETTELAMSLFAGNPRTLENLKKREQIILPSATHLSKIKNTVKQVAGINEANLEWMRLIANEENRPAVDFCGGLL